METPVFTTPTLPAHELAAIEADTAKMPVRYRDMLVTGVQIGDDGEFRKDVPPPKIYVSDPYYPGIPKGPE